MLSMAKNRRKESYHKNVRKSSYYIFNISYLIVYILTVLFQIIIVLIINKE